MTEYTITVSDRFWHDLEDCAKERGCTVDDLVEKALIEDLYR